MRYSWGNPKNSDYVLGFAGIYYFTPDNRLGPEVIIEARNIPLNKSQEIKTIFDQMIKTVRVLE